VGGSEQNDGPAAPAAPARRRRAGALATQDSFPDQIVHLQHPALCESDSWHAEEGYVSDRGQESYYYHDSGRLVGMDYYSPDIDQPVRRGVAA
jgi:hypothetical protein